MSHDSVRKSKKGKLNLKDVANQQLVYREETTEVSVFRHSYGLAINVIRGH